MLLVSAHCPLKLQREAMWYRLSALEHFCDTPDGTAEQQKRPDKARAKKLWSGNVIAVETNQLCILLLYTMKFDECRAYLLAAWGPEVFTVASLGSKTKQKGSYGPLLMHLFSLRFFFLNFLLEFCIFVAIRYSFSYHVLI